MKKVALMMLAALIFAGMTVLGQAPVAQKLASGTYTVYAISPQVWRVNIDPKTMGNATISGHFTVTEGTPKTIDVMVFDQDNYTKWKNEESGHNTPKPVGAVMQAGDGTITATLTEPGFHYLVISDRHEYEGKKVVNADISLTYQRQ